MSITELCNERGRIKNDKKANSTKVIKIIDGKEQETSSSEILVGDIIRIKDDQLIPADCILLSSYENLAKQRRSTVKR